MKLLICCSFLVLALHCTEGKFDWSKLDQGNQGNQGSQGNQNQDDQGVSAELWRAGQSGVVDTCGLQKDVVTFTVDRVPGTSCKGSKGQLDYEFRVCLHLNLVKNLTSIKKSCVKSNSTVNPPPFGFYDKLYWVNSSVGMAMGGEVSISGGYLYPDYPVTNSSEQCQLGCPNTTLYFSLHDGKYCKPTAESGLADWAEIDGVKVPFPGADRPTSAQCKSRAGWLSLPNPDTSLNESCICETPQAECVWKFDIPEEVDKNDASPGPSPSPQCFCPPLSNQCNKEVQVEQDNGKTNLVEVLDCGNPEYLADQLKSYGCQVPNKDCPTVVCDTFIPPDIVKKYSTCQQ